MNRRRKLIIALGAGALVAPFRSLAQQQGKVWRVGILSARHVDFVESDVYYGAFRQGLRELGYAEGKNLVIEWRSAEGKFERLPGLATELVNLQVDVIVAGGTPATSSAQKATATIPIVMSLTGNPIGSEFIKSLARPAGNITGTTRMAEDISMKQFEMLLSMLPKLSRLAVLVNPSNMGKSNQSVRAEAEKRGIKVLSAEARTPQQIDEGFSLMRQENVGAVFVMTDTLFQQQKNQIVELAAKHRLPLITAYREFTEAGVLMSYGPNLADALRRAAYYVDRIFKGAKPGELPVEQPTKFELIINGKTAKALGVKIPQSLLISADKVIE